MSLPSSWPLLLLFSSFTSLFGPQYRTARNLTQIPRLLPLPKLPFPLSLPLEPFDLLAPSDRLSDIAVRIAPPPQPTPITPSPILSPSPLPKAAASAQRPRHSPFAPRQTQKAQKQKIWHRHQNQPRLRSFVAVYPTHRSTHHSTQTRPRKALAVDELQVGLNLCHDMRLLSCDVLSMVCLCTLLFSSFAYPQFRPILLPVAIAQLS
jgi:hypothetical protein